MQALDKEPLLRDLVDGDITSLVDLFRSCYGTTYSNPIFYDAAVLRDHVVRGSLRSVVAEQSGRLVGHMALTVHHDGALICEAGNTVVDPDARGHGVMAQLGMALHDRTRREGFLGYIHYPTTAHDIMQRASVMKGGVETGVLLGYIPADTEYTAIDKRNHRLAVTVAFQPLDRMPPRNLARLPERYADLLTEIYHSAGLDRIVPEGDHAVAFLRNSVLSHSFNPRRKALHVSVDSVGDDLDESVRKMLNERDPAVAIVDLPVDALGIDAAVESLRSLGFFFAALHPEFCDTDILRLQRLRDRSAEVLNPTLANDGARGILEFIRADMGS